MITLLILLVFVLVIASTWWFGIWNNLLTLINLLLAGLIASGFYENVTEQLNQSMSGWKNVTSFLAVWLTFVVSFMVLRALTDMISSKKLKFERTTEIIGQSVLSVWIACVFLAFMLFTLHLSPLPPTAFQEDPASSTLGIGPDRFWLAFVQSRSRGALSTPKEESLVADKFTGPSHPDDAELDARVFDAEGSFIPTNIIRRQGLAERKTLIN